MRGTVKSRTVHWTSLRGVFENYGLNFGHYWVGNHGLAGGSKQEDFGCVIKGFYGAILVSVYIISIGPPTALSR